MCLLLETVKVQNRRLQNIEAHNLRAMNSRRILFGLEDTLDFRDFITLPDDLDDGIYKCRIVYAQAVQQVELLPYIPKRIQTLRLVLNDAIQYQHKYLDRSYFGKLLQSVNTDDVLIVQHGLITDSSFANVVFYDGKKWVTPTQPLFHGIKRQILLEKGLIHENEISQKDLHRFIYAVLINAMLDIGDTPFISMANILSPATLC
jgi:Branched-chain amino acid aminotransferase/4-amino-4-deoxychorismate lyase